MPATNERQGTLEAIALSLAGLLAPLVSRLVIVEESWRTMGLGAEIAAAVQELAFDDLDAPIGRVGSLEVPMPYAKNLERLIIPGKDEVIAAVREVMR